MTGTHPSTYEVTRDPEISAAADCIVAVGADKGAASLSREFKAAAARDDAYITCSIEAGGARDVVRGWGSRALTFTDENSMVFRVSGFTCGRTVMVNADRPAAGLDRLLIKKLAAGSPAVVELSVARGERPKPSFDLLFLED